MVSLSLSLDSLISSIGNEADKILERKYKLRSLSNQLRLMQTYIQNSGFTPEQSDIEREVTNQIRRITYEAEDLISDYTTRVASDKGRDNLIKAVKSYRMVREFVGKVEELNNEITETLDNKKKYERPGPGELDRPIPDLDFHVNDVVVDFVNDMAKLVNLLIEDLNAPRVISIVGMGGSGKTALAYKLFTDKRIENHFDCTLWIPHKQGVSSSDILREIVGNLRIKDMNDSILQTMNDDKLKEIVSKHLIETKYLIVVDNMCETDTWDQLEKVFPKSSNGSRIVITSRNSGVGRYSNSAIHFLPLLAESDGRELFCMKAFKDDPFPNNLKTVVQQVVNSCHGLPLTLLVLGRLLAEKEREEHRWSTFIGSVNSYPDEGRRHWRAKLATSYDQLQPANLKLCFFYLGVFPADYEIPVSQLIQMWIAEELIPQNDGTILENIAEEYLNQLIDRCLIQRTSSRLDGRVKTCRVHNVLRDLCVWESKRDDFLEVRTENSTSGSNPRRLAVHFSLLDFSSVSSTCSDCSSIRSFFYFAQQSYCIDGDHWKWLCKIKVVRVLNLGDVQVELIPESIGELILLKYLKLKGRKLNVIPRSIGKLWKLETLDLRDSEVNCLPKEIWKLVNLRHLCLSHPTKLLDPPSSSRGRIGSFPYLQAISNLVLDQENAHLITKERFPLVKKLGFYINSSQTEILHDVLETVYKLRSLSSLKIEANSSEHLGLRDSLCLLRLQNVTLVKSKINSNDLHVLGKLPKLRYFKLIEGNLDSNILQCEPSSFAQLLAFQMTRFPIQNWTLSEGAMPSLHRLIIKDCQELRGLPERQRLTNLKEVCVHSPCSSDLTATLQRMKNEMGDWCNIQIFD